MSGRSSRRELLLVALACGCGHKQEAPPKPEADPAQAKALAAEMLANAPTPGSVRDCAQADFDGGAMTMTHNTLLEIAGKPLAKDPEHAEWINPPSLDHIAAHTLADPSADPKLARQAAAEMLRAPFYLIYKIDNVDAPVAIGVKELKIGTIGARIIRYAKTGRVDCAMVFLWQNTAAKNAWAIEKSDRAFIDPGVAKAMQDDLVSEYLRLAPRGK